MKFELPPEIEDYRDTRWRRDPARQVGSANDAERFVEEVGFTACLTDARRPGPSLYVAVCGRRDAIMPRNVQTDEEASLTWTLKDDLIRRGKVYYAKLSGGRATFIAPRLVSHFHSLWGLRRAEEPRRLSRRAQAILRVLRREWEMATADLREESGVKDRVAFTKALDELQAAMLVIPSDVHYQPKFTYIWTLAVGRFPDALRRRPGRDAAVREIARAFLNSAGLTVRGELARVTGLSRPEAGRGNCALVAEGYAHMSSNGVTSWSTCPATGGPKTSRERIPLNQGAPHASHRRPPVSFVRARLWSGNRRSATGASESISRRGRPDDARHLQLGPLGQGR